MKKIFLTTKDNVKIAANHYDNGFKNVVIIVPGWFMTKDSKAFCDISADFAKHCDVLTMDCRGHGKSSGFYTFTAKELNDLSAVVDFAKQRYEKIFLAGFSLGGSLVLMHGALNNDVEKIIAISAASDFDKIENQVWHPNAWIPTFKKFELKRWLSIRPSFILHKKIKPLDVVDKITVPTLFIAGGRDITVKPWHTKALYDKALCRKEFNLMEKSIHAEDLFIAEPEKFMDLCINWISF